MTPPPLAAVLTLAVRELGIHNFEGLVDGMARMREQLDEHRQLTVQHGKQQKAMTAQLTQLTRVYEKLSRDTARRKVEEEVQMKLRSGGS